MHSSGCGRFSFAGHVQNYVAVTTAFAAKRGWENYYAAFAVDPDGYASRYISAVRPHEHPFGTLKAWMGATHFLTRTLDKVRTEMSLHVLAYNLKRMITIFAAAPLMAAIRT